MAIYHGYSYVIGGEILSKAYFRNINIENIDLKLNVNIWLLIVLSFYGT